MAFSFFGKKPPPEPAPSRKPAAPAAREPASEPKPGATGTGAQPAAGRSADSGLDKRPEAAEPLPSLDFTDESSFNATNSEIAASIEIHDASEVVHPAVEEAAVLFANAQYEQAWEAIERSIARDDLGNAAEQLWWMLFDALHACGDRERFEARALDYAMKFGKSPPAWVGGERAAAEGVSGGSAVPMASLGTRLDQSVTKQLEVVRRMMSKSATLRLDGGKVKEVDDEGCTRLLELMQNARKAKQEVIVQNASSLARVIQSGLATGTPEGQNRWLLMLELLQHLADQDAFEEWALNYAITFEVSPPSWEPPKPRPKPKAAVAPAAPAQRVTEGADAFEIKGELAGACGQVMEALKDYASRNAAVVIDLSQLKRIDFVCAGNLLNTLFGILPTGKTVRLRGASASVAALLNVIGIQQAAPIERRRY